MKRSYQSMPVYEEWKVIEGFPDYLVSNLGRVCSNKFKISPRQKNTKVIINITLRNSVAKYLFITKALIIS